MTGLRKLESGICSEPAGPHRQMYSDPVRAGVALANSNCRAVADIDIHSLT